MVDMEEYPCSPFTFDLHVRPLETMPMRFVAKAESGKGWRIWDNQQKKWWGQVYQNHPVQLIAELNGQKRPARLTELAKQTERKRV